MQDLVHGDTTYKIRGAAFEVYNSLGFGHKELVYQRALAKEFEKRGIFFKREQKLSVSYKGEKVGDYIPDFTVEDKVIVEIKSLEFIPQKASEQLVNYLKGTGYKVGILINFGAPKLQIIRKVWETGSVKICLKSA